MQSATAQSSTTANQNVSGMPGPAERAISVTSGALLMLPVLRKRSKWRWTAAAAGGALIFRGVTGHGVTDTLSTSNVRGQSITPIQSVKQSITIGKSTGELFELWRNTDVLTRVMHPFAEVDAIGPEHLRWSVKLPAGTLNGEAMLVESIPNEVIRWRTSPATAIEVEELMRFVPAAQGLGTVAILEYTVDFSRVPAGPVLRAIASFFERVPRVAVQKVLRNFKSFAETGEMPTLERNPSGRSRNNGKGDLV
jgi:uncharacterized membrane protein